MAEWITIFKYWDFWDIPRTFVASYAGVWFYFQCPFEDDTEDYSEYFSVYELPPMTSEEITRGWKGLPGSSARHLGLVRTESVEFDESRRRGVNLDILQNLGWIRPQE